MPEPLTLYVVPASHPCVAVMKALELKGLPYERVDFMFGVSVPMQIARFRARTVPGLTIGARKVAGSRAIMRAPEDVEPSPPLVPADPDRRAAVTEAERWGDVTFQEHTRWIAADGRGPRAAVVPEFQRGPAAEPRRPRAGHRRAALRPPRPRAVPGLPGARPGRDVREPALMAISGVLRTDEGLRR